MVFQSGFRCLPLRQTTLAGVHAMVTRAFVLLMADAAGHRAKEALKVYGAVLNRAELLAGQNRFTAVVTDHSWSPNGDRSTLRRQEGMT